MSKKELSTVHKKDILSYIKERGCVYESELLTALSESDNETTRREILSSVIQLSWDGKIDIIKRSDLSILRVAQEVYH